ncbi:hypothetical protein [Streptomyces sp. NPDC002779]|uniref:hypothetical protein n=1 Tax=Streptomyces sp. NPDC002779 TaxID=3364664 RepID=UPI00369E93FF
MLAAAWNGGSPGAGTAKVSHSSRASSSLTASAKGVAELLERQRHRTVEVGRVAEHRPRRAQRGQRQHPAERRRIDGHRRLGQLTAGDWGACASPKTAAHRSQLMDSSHSPCRLPQSA